MCHNTYNTNCEKKMSTNRKKNIRDLPFDIRKKRQRRIEHAALTDAQVTFAKNFPEITMFNHAVGMLTDKETEILEKEMLDNVLLREMVEAVVEIVDKHKITDFKKYRMIVYE